MPNLTPSTATVPNTTTTVTLAREVRHGRGSWAVTVESTDGLLQSGTYHHDSPADARWRANMLWAKAVDARNAR